MQEYVTDYPGFHPLQVQSSRVGASFSGRKPLNRCRGREKNMTNHKLENGFKRFKYQHKEGYDRSFEID